MELRVEPIAVGRKRIWVHPETDQERRVLEAATTAHEPCFAFVSDKDWDLWQHDPYGHDALVQEGHRLFARRVVLVRSDEGDFHVDTTCSSYREDLDGVSSVHELMLGLELIWAAEERQRLKETMKALRQSAALTAGEVAPVDRPVSA